MGGEKQKGSVNKVVLAIVVGTVIAAFIVYWSITRGMCAYYGSQTNRDTRYAAFIGCMVQTDRGWTPRGELRTAQ